MPAKDLFGDRAAHYARYRPHYPEALFDHLAALAPARARAWDCGTGSGQTARALATRFEHVVATDVSRRQLAEAARAPGVDYAASSAESAPLRAASVDLVTVSTAVHWFDRSAFYAEVRRVARPGAVVAVWSYYEARIAPAIDPLLMHFADQIVGEHWDPGMRLNRTGYRDLEFPFERLEWPALSASARMRLEDLMGFMRTWSASQAYERHHGTDPVDRVRDPLTRAWGDPETEREVRWPLHGRLGRVRD